MTQNQSQRQATASENQADRQAAAQSAQSNRQAMASEAHEHYHDDDDWDNGGAFIGGALVGGAMVAASRPATAYYPPTTTTYVTNEPAPAPAPAYVPPPCNVAPIEVSGVPYYNCGKTWYTEGYASNGPVYMPVPPPPGY
jgi:hypothetical protein